MIIQAAKSKGTIITLKLADGAEIVGSFVSEDDKSIKLRKPLLAVMTQQGPTLTPYVMTVDVITDTQELSFPKSFIVIESKTFKPFADAYTQATSGIAPPPPGGIVGI